MWRNDTCRKYKQTGTSTDPRVKLSRCMQWYMSAAEHCLSLDVINSSFYLPVIKSLLVFDAWQPKGSITYDNLIFIICDMKGVVWNLIDIHALIKYFHDMYLMFSLDYQDSIPPLILIIQTLCSFLQFKMITFIRKGCSFRFRKAWTWFD